MSALTVMEDLSDLPALVDHARTALANARSAAEVLQAKELAGHAYDRAKRVGRFARAKAAHDDLIKAAHEVQGDAAEIEHGAIARLAEEYSTAQERGEVHSATSGARKGVSDGNAISPVSTADIGISRKTIHDGRLVQAAEEAQPGIVHRTVKDLVERGEEPTKAAIGRAVAEAAGRPAASKPKPEPGEAFTRFISLAADMGRLAPKDIVAGIPAANRRAELMGHVRGLRDMLEAVDEIVEGVAL